MLFLATAIYDCVNIYTVVHGQRYSSSLYNTYNTSRHRLRQPTMQYGHQPGMSVAYYNILQTGSADNRIAGR